MYGGIRLFISINPFLIPKYVETVVEIPKVRCMEKEFVVPSAAVVEVPRDGRDVGSQFDKLAAAGFEDEDMKDFGANMPAYRACRACSACRACRVCRVYCMCLALPYLPCLPAVHAVPAVLAVLAVSASTPLPSPPASPSPRLPPLPRPALLATPCLPRSHLFFL